MTLNIQLPYHDRPFLAGGGVMGELIRNKDWSTTSIGLPDTWNPVLKLYVAQMLSNPFPMLICWGADYIQFYNDSFRPINGESKHPQALGGSAKDTYAEIWDTIGPMFAGVMQGQPVGFPNFMVPLDRNGYLEDCYFDFSYSPIKDQDGHIHGVLVICVETTEKVRVLDKLNEVNSEMAASRQEALQQRNRLNEFFMQAPAGICILSGPELTFELVNPLYQQLFPGRDILGKTMFEAIPEVEGAPIWDVLQRVLQTGETFEGHELLIPLARTDDGPVEDRYFDFIYQARKNTDGQIDGLFVFVNEVTGKVLADQELQARTKKLEDSEARFRFLLNAMPQQVWTATPDGALNYVNEVVSADFGYNQQEIVGHGWQKFIHPDDLQVCLDKWLASLATGKEYTVEFRLLFKDGNYYWHLARAVPLIEEEKIRLWLGTNTNIELQKNNELQKDEFLSIASHELKTPLTSIKAFNQILQRLDDPEKSRSFINKSAEHIIRLERLINDLLDVTKINSGKMVYEQELFDFSKMLNETVESNRHLSARHEILLDDQAQVSFTGDRYRLEQVINNFISNALKYSPTGKKIIVSSKIELNNIIVSVQDFGIGIAAENLDKLFDRYYRVDNTAMRFEGLGLGLFISSEILKRHKGSFWIESELGQGSTFFFRLPLPEISKPTTNRNTATFYQDSTVTISFNAEKARLDVDWTGFQDLESVQHGCILMLEMMQKSKVHKIVNDNTHVLGSWSEAVEWTGNVWFPQMEKAGLQYFALIYSPSVFSQLSAKKSIDVGIGSIIAQYFTDIALAEEWMDVLGSF